MNQPTNQLALVQQVIVSEDMQRQMKTLLPPSVRLDKFTEVTIAAIQSSPEVLEGDKDSLYRACISAARRGLLPDKREGALVVFNTNVAPRNQPERWVKMVQFLPMVEGIIKEMAKAGIKAYAVSVYENDTIALWNDDDGQHVKHEPTVFKERGKMVGVFAAALTQDGRPYVEPMNMDDLYRVAGRSKQCKKDNNGQVVLGGTWKSDFERMAQKSALHRVRKRLPITDEDALQNLRDMEEETDINLSPAENADSAPQSEPSSPSLPSPEQSNQQDEVIKPAAKPRRSRVLQGVVEQAQKSNGGPSAAQQKEAAPSSSAGSAGASTARAESTAAPSKSAPPPVEEEYNEDDIV